MRRLYVIALALMSAGCGREGTPGASDDAGADRKRRNPDTNTAPQVTIDLPEDGRVVSEGATIGLSGRVSDDHDEPPELEIQ